MENGKYCAYIGADNSSGYEIQEDTPSECARRIGQYFEEYINW